MPGGNKLNINLGPLEDEQVNLILNDEGITNILNEFFMRVFNRDFNYNSVSTDSRSQDIKKCNFIKEVVLNIKPFKIYLENIKPFKAQATNMYLKIY